MKRRTILRGMLGAISLRAGDASLNPRVATISVGGKDVASMQAAADTGGEIRVTSGELGFTPERQVIGAAHFRKAATVVGQATRIIDQSIENKGTFIVDAEASFEGFDIAGARGDGIGAAFRHQSGNLVVRRTTIHRCENGLLGPARYVDATLVVDACDVFDNGTGTGQTHGLYVGEIASFTCTNSRFRATNIGHHIKSRARTTRIEDCQVGTDFSGNESFNIDVPQGGDAAIVRCHLRQGRATDNQVMLNFGGERAPHPGGSLIVTRTVFESDTGGTGIRVHANVDVVASLRDCTFVGIDVPVDGPCLMINCWHNGRRLSDGRHGRRRAR